MKYPRVFWFAHYNLAGPCVRYRGRYLLDYLGSKEGLRSTFIVPGYAPGNILHFARAWFSALLFCGKEDVIVFQKIHTRGIYATALKLLLLARRRHAVYDIDDAYYMKFPPVTIEWFIRRSAVVVAGSGELAEFAKRFNNVVVLNPSPVIAHGLMKRDREPLLTVGWIGFYNAHRESLQSLFFPALEGIGIPVRLVLLGVTRPEHREEIRCLFSENAMVRVDMPGDIDWLDEHSVYRRICTFDVGIAPLLDTPYNRAKSAFKAKQCLSCGVPVLASPTGENNAVIGAGKNGLFCDGPEEFRDALLRFSRMGEEEYRGFSRGAAESAKGFSMEGFGRVYSEVFSIALTSKLDCSTARLLDYSKKLHREPQRKK